MTAGASPALAGTAADLEPTSAFEWYFSQPFSKQSPFTPARQVLPPIEDERPIFVDEASGRFPTVHITNPARVSQNPRPRDKQEEGKKNSEKSQAKRED